MSVVVHLKVKVADIVEANEVERILYAAADTFDFDYTMVDGMDDIEAESKAFDKEMEKSEMDQNLMDPCDDQGVEAPAIVARRLLEERRHLNTGPRPLLTTQVDTALAQLAGRVIGDILQLLPRQGKELDPGVVQVLADLTIRDRGGVIPTPDHTPDNCAELAARYIRKISEKEAVDLYRDQLAQEYHDHPAEYDADSHLFRDAEFDNPIDYDPTAK